jgi:hypothetical protein
MFSIGLRVSGGELLDILRKLESDPGANPGVSLGSRARGCEALAISQQSNRINRTGASFR